MLGGSSLQATGRWFEPVVPLTAISHDELAARHDDRGRGTHANAAPAHLQALQQHACAHTDRQDEPTEVAKAATVVVFRPRDRPIRAFVAVAAVAVTSAASATVASAASGTIARVHAVGVVAKHAAVMAERRA